MPFTARYIPPEQTGAKLRFSESFVPCRAVMAAAMRMAEPSWMRPEAKSRKRARPMPQPSSAAMPPAPGPAAATQPRAKGASPPPIRAAHSAAARKKRTPISGSSRRRASVHCDPFPKARPSSAAHGGDLLAAHGSRPGRENPVGK